MSETTFPYEDIVNLPHHVSAKHPPMPSEMRAAQFSPFQALTGYEDAVLETQRLTDVKRELDDDEKAILDASLQALSEKIAECPYVEITYFVPDKEKSGGAYVTCTGNLKKIDSVLRTLTLTDGTMIQMDDIMRVG